jgi:hypothetical protein
MRQAMLAIFAAVKKREDLFCWLFILVFVLFLAYEALTSSCPPGDCSDPLSSVPAHRFRPSAKQ